MYASTKYVIRVSKFISPCLRKTSKNQERTISSCHDTRGCFSEAMNGIITSHIIVNTMHTATMDVVRLRKALRLMHCLQKERGASCAVVSSGEEFAIAMKLARDATDAASMQLYREMPKSLDKIRKQLDTQTNSTQVHRMLVIYKTLISNVEHEFVRTCLSAAQMPHRNNKTLQSQRSRSTNDFDEYESMEFPQKKDLPSSFMISCSDPNRYYTPQVTRSHKAFTPMHTSHSTWRQTSFSYYSRRRISRTKSFYFTIKSLGMSRSSQGKHGYATSHDIQHDGNRVANTRHVTTLGGGKSTQTCR